MIASTIVLIIISLIYLKIDMDKRRKKEDSDGIERKSLAILGMMFGAILGIMIFIILWRLVDTTIFSVGPFVILGTILGSKITKSDDDKKERITRYKKIVNMGIIFIIFMSIVCVIIFGIKVVPVKDRISCANLPEQIYVYSEDNYYAFQSGSDCSGYATAYILRNQGIDIEGEDLYKEFDKFFGYVAVHNIVDKLKEYDIKAYAYHGNIETLKCRLNQGKPVIALVTIAIDRSNGLHYFAIVGYDEEYIYVADSTKPYTNVYDKKQYNRKLTYEQFESIWNTSIYPVKNVYITVD
ncbi:MAG: C39 family peptidase [Lachnospiraceae bacterium]|nr:C39 family peptidase [Lachnospiraceae bacterium]